MSITCLEIIGSYFLPGVTLATALSSVWAGGQSCGMGQMTKHCIPCGSEMSRAESHIGQPHLLTQREQDPLLPFLLYVWRKPRDRYGGRPQDTKWYSHNSADASNTGSVCGRSHPSRTLCAYPYPIYLPLPPTSSSSASMSVPSSCQLKQGTLQPDTHGLYIPASVYPSSSSHYPEQFLKIDSGLPLSCSELLYSSL